MRIISGEFKGRKFSPPQNKKYPTRPTTDYAKEGLFNILINRFDFDSLDVLDLFGGFGGMCFEFASRGCKSVTYVDRNKACSAFVLSVSEKLGIEDVLNIQTSDVKQFLKYNTGKYDLVFVDPPYEMPGVAFLPELLMKSELLNEDGILIFEHNSNQDFKNVIGFNEKRNYGKSFFSFFK